MIQYKNSLIAGAVILLIVAYSILFTIQQTSSAIVLRLGKIVETADHHAKVLTAGLHAKWPFIDQVVEFDNRLQTLDIQDSRIVTKEKKDVIVNLFVKWRIADFATFYKATRGDVRSAEILLEQKVSDGIRAEFGQRTIAEVVSGERINIM